MQLIVYYVIFMIAGDLAAYFIGLILLRHKVRRMFLLNLSAQ